MRRRLPRYEMNSKESASQALALVVDVNAIQMLITAIWNAAAIVTVVNCNVTPSIDASGGQWPVMITMGVTVSRMPFGTLRSLT